MRAERYFSLPEPLALARGSGEALHLQIARYFRQLIVSGKLDGIALPSSRALARELSCSRNTVVLAYDQLAAEGFFEPKARSATKITPAAASTHRNLELAPSAASETTPPISQLAQKIAATTKPDLQRFTALSPIGNLDIFPFDTWTRLYREIWRDPPRDLLLDRDPMGYLPLRTALADHLRVSRGLQCDAGNIVITSGTVESMSLIMTTLLNPGDDIWIENPSFAEAVAFAGLSSMNVHAIDVDENGLSVADGIAKQPDARLCLVAPTHHFPLGMTMSLERRIELLGWAARANAWIVEDDYDSELILATRAIPALRSLSPDGRVIYVGSFSKSLFPNLRIGYVIANPDIASIIAKAKVFMNGPTSLQLQPVISAFIEGGHLARHLARSTSIYARQRTRALESIDRYLSEYLTISPTQKSIHIAAEFSDPACHLDDRDVVRAAAERGFAVRTLSQYYPGYPKRHGLVFGFASASADEFDRAMSGIAAAIADQLHNARGAMVPAA